MKKKDFFSINLLAKKVKIYIKEINTLRMASDSDQHSARSAIDKGHKARVSLAGSTLWAAAVSVVSGD